MLGGIGWYPTHEDIKGLGDHLEAALGDEYQIIVYHPGIEITVVNGEEAEIKQAEITSLEELREELSKKYETPTNYRIEDD